ncbi:MAG: 4Fe-4S dicluster domain-containing protein [Caldilineae bacterium]|nr:4Fe-4S dicluster domain-containing protein [Anaerolineae bacterium]MCB0198554.1 4Fe-4S dicluster domain-containing protein [Anaerolineae bacterium]MCB0203952.1 4Fe-4S dicluster domain-containing protein [Anaerolineae bacterium]MCB9152534.1 4Fe-4S dicluster domain-containing protein [Caldilineae bacterium]
MNEVMSRRTFLKHAGVGAAVCAAGGLAVQPALASEGTSSANAWGVLVDLTRCNGCDSCALACKQANQRPEEDQIPNQLSSDSYSFVDRRVYVGDAGQEQQMPVKRQCMHCLHPACVSACTVGALTKTPDGPVVYDSSKCIGCRYCQYACPFGVPTYDWANPLGLIHKCQFCISRLDEGEQPACVAGCPTGALRFGTRNDLLAQAHSQIDSNPGRYIDQIYGESELGGTSVLYLSGVPFAAMGLPTLDSQSPSRYAEAVMRKTPVIGLTVAALASGAYWLTKRREFLAQPEVVPQEVNHDR